MREMLAGSEGCDCSTAGMSATRGTAVASATDGAWHEPPQPQSKPRASVGADTVEALVNVWSLLVATSAPADSDIAMPGSQTIPPAAPSNESSNGS